ncbi:MAG: glycosyltransferase [Candidatus Omnitrophica bacterium]|nr:glycosyltransferase [Candidatus Omnitrophota bacterium]
MKIMYVVHSLGVGGVEKLVYNMIERSARYDIEPIVCCLDHSGLWGEELKRKGFKVFDLNRKEGIDLKVVKKLRAILKEERPDIAHAHQYTPYFYTILSVFWFHGPKIVFTEHGRFFPDRMSGKRVIFNQIAMLFTGAIIGVCEFSKRSLIKYEKFPGDRIEVIYNGVRPEEFSIDSDISLNKISLSLNANNKIIGTVGRLCKEKNYSMLIRAFGEIKRHLKDAKLLIVGDGELRGELENSARNENVENEVLFLGERRDIPELMKVFDVFVLSSDLEAASLVLLEAMASGVPVVATNVGGNPELVLDGVTGLLAPKNDHQKFGEAVVDILQDPDRAKKMGKAGRTRVIEKFSFDRMVNEYVEVYRSLISCKKI